MINLKKCSISTTKDPNQNVREKYIKLNLSLSKEEILKKEKNLLNVHSNINIKNNILELINKNETNDKNISFSYRKKIYSLKKRIFSPNFKIKK